MNVLVLDAVGSPATIGSISKELNKGRFKTDVIALHSAKLIGCQSCFTCWVKDPGTCRIRDDAREIAIRYASADLVIFVTETIFGTYSLSMNQMIERLLPNMLPYFEKENGEYVHPPRYTKRPGILFFGLHSSNEEDEQLKDLIDRNCKILLPRFYRTVILDGKKNERSIRSAMTYAKGEMA